MPTNALVQTRIDGEIKEEAAAVLSSIGLTVSDAVRMLLTRVAQEKALPFTPVEPSAKTLAAVREARARKGKLRSHSSVESLMADLHADD